MITYHKIIIKLLQILILSCAYVNVYAQRYTCNVFVCKIDSQGVNNYIAVQLNVSVLDITSSVDVNNQIIPENIIFISQLSNINRITLVDVNHNSNYILTLKSNELIAIQNIEAPDLTVNIKDLDQSYIKIINAQIKNFILSDSHVFKENSNYTVYNQDANTFSKVSDLTAKNINLDVNFDPLTTSNSNYDISLSDANANNSLSLQNMNNINITISSLTNNLALKKLELSYHEDGVGNIISSTIDNFTINDFFIKKGNLLISQDINIKGNNVVIDNIIAQDNSSIYNINIDAPNVAIGSTDGYINYTTKLGSLALGDEFDSHTNVFKNVNFGGKNLIITGDTTIVDVTFYPQNNQTLSLINANFNLTNPLGELKLDLLTIDNGYFNASNVGSIITKELNLKNNFSLNANSINTSLINAEITQYHQDNNALNINTIINPKSTIINVTTDSTTLLSVGEVNTYHLLNSLNAQDVSIIYPYSRDWISYKTILSQDQLDVEVTRIKSYFDVINPYSANEFAKSLAFQLDSSMASGSITKDVETLIKNLDIYSQTSPDLLNNLTSMQPINKNTLINTLYRQDSHSIYQISKNLTTLNPSLIWGDIDINMGSTNENSTEYGNSINLGARIKIIQNHYVGLATTFGSSKITNSAYENNINTLSFVTGYSYFSSGLYFNANLLQSFNDVTAYREDNFNNVAQSDSSYNNTMVGLVAGKNFYKKDLTIINNISFLFNTIKMDPYQEVGQMIYSYESAKYNIYSVGYTIGLAKEPLINGFGWETKILLGNKYNKQIGNENLLFQLENTTFTLQDNPLEASGLLIKPEIGFQYIFGKTTLEGYYIMEYLQNGYQNNKIKLTIKLN